ncbi:hypothetical protein E3P99_01935 [Wallemia hederae]|uniref:Amine oxidase n=1 Tax=Wallemia hederae TaxID=1540922 RepID=A0A4T0FMW0_9BASI|nr:hypothetical protein E3P99_01935 [Wallemia hederae]
MRSAAVLVLGLASLGLSFCPQFASFEDTANEKQNPFNQLTTDEFNEAYNFIYDKFNLTSLEDAGTADNYVELLTLKPPKKYEALDYLNDSGDKPLRYAKAVIVHGTDSDPSIKTYTVGPLNQDSIDVHSTNTPPIPHNSRRTKAHKDAMMEKVFVYYALAPISEIIEDLLGRPWNLEEYMYLDERLNLDGDKRLRWLELAQKPDDSAFWGGFTGFHILIDFSGQKFSDWKVLKIVYGDRVWRGLQAFVDDYNDGQVANVMPQFTENELAHWTRRRPDVPVRDLEDRPAPISVSKEGLRYRLDDKENHVSWLNWDFFFAHNPETGISIHDLRFNDVRIAYEISLQEAVSHYSANTPTNANSALLDRGIGLGEKLTPLIRGYDCAEEATYLSTHNWNGTHDVVTPDTVCIFEMPLIQPISRHYGLNDASSNKATKLVVRSISTPGNYDYMIDYALFPDGTIEASASASGYLLQSHSSKGGEEFGTQVSDTTFGNVHDHVILFKFDLDILGESNTLVEKSIDVQKRKFFWQDEDEDGYESKVIKSANVEHEKGMDWSNNYDHWLLLSNLDKKTRYGYNPAYRIMPSTPVIHDTPGTQARMQRNAVFSREHVYVTKYNEEEETASSMYNMNLPNKPPVDFGTFLNDESIVQEDLVLWANVGMHHLPRASDVPSTLFLETKSGIMLSPFNYGTEELSRDLTNVSVWHAIGAGNLTAKQAVYATIDNVTDLIKTVEVYNDADSCGIEPFNQSLLGLDTSK